MLTTYAKQQDNKTLKNYAILLIQHVLSDLEPFLLSLKSIGAKSDQMVVVGIPYSSKHRIIEELRKKYDIKIFESKTYPFEKEVTKAINYILDICKKKKIKFVIIEDGGYAVPQMHKKFLSDISFCKGAVEQTMNGIWRDEELIKDLNRKNEKLLFPVISVPHCTLKQKIEGPFVGKAVIKNIQSLLSKIGEFIEGKKICVIGYGTIGENVALEAKHQNSIVSIVDIDPIKLLTACFNGFETDNLLNLLKNSDIVIGTTGSRSIGSEEILSIKNNSVLVSASSKRIEIDIDKLDKFSTNNRKTDIGTEYKLVNGNNILLLANGFPVNFFQSESVPNKVIDIILTFLLLGAVSIINNDLSPELLKCPIDEKRIAKIFREIHYPHGK